MQPRVGRNHYGRKWPPVDTPEADEDRLGSLYPPLDIPLSITEKHCGTGKDGRVFDVNSYSVVA
jgi:hypothetical protein